MFTAIQKIGKTSATYIVFTLSRQVNETLCANLKTPISSFEEKKTYQSKKSKEKYILCLFFSFLKTNEACVYRLSF